MKNYVIKFNTLSKIGWKRNSFLLLNFPFEYPNGSLNATRCNVFSPKSSSLLDCYLPIQSVKSKSGSCPQLLPLFNLLHPVGKQAFEKSVPYSLPPLLPPWSRPPKLASLTISTPPSCWHHSNLSCIMLA